MRRHQQGIGLPELIISLLLTSFIVVMLMHHYINVKHHYHRIKTSLEQAIDLLLLTDLMRNSVRRAGFTPCLGLNQLIAVDSRDEPHPMHAFEMDSKGESWVRFQRMSEYFDTVLAVVNVTQLITTSFQPIYPKQSVLIADCYHAEVHTVKQVKHGPTGRVVIIDKPLIFSYGEPIYLGEWVEETYSLRQRDNHSHTLFYQRYHVEALTTAIHSLSASSIQGQPQALLKIRLELDKFHPIELETRVRVP